MKGQGTSGENLDGKVVALNVDKGEGQIEHPSRLEDLEERSSSQEDGGVDNLEKGRQRGG